MSTLQISLSINLIVGSLIAYFISNIVKEKLAFATKAGTQKEKVIESYQEFKTITKVVWLLILFILTIPLRAFIQFGLHGGVFALITFGLSPILIGMSLLVGLYKLKKVTLP